MWDLTYCWYQILSTVFYTTHYTTCQNKVIILFKKNTKLTKQPTELFYSTLNLSPIPKPLLKEQPEPKELHLFSLDKEKTPLFSIELSAVFNDMKVNSLISVHTGLILYIFKRI